MLSLRLVSGLMLSLWIFAGLSSTARADEPSDRPADEHTPHRNVPAEDVPVEDVPAEDVPVEDVPAAALGPKSPSAELLDSLQPPSLRTLAHEVLERNPDIARARQLAAAAAARAPRVASLPDPVAALSLFVLPPETRAGPQLFSVSLMQAFPWFGKLALREQIALHAAAAARAEVEKIRLDKLREIRRLAIELAFLDSQEAIVRSERNALLRYEEAAQARYSSGNGLQQAIVRIQAQITRIDTRLLEIAERRITLRAAVDRLRDRPQGTPLARLELPALVDPDFDSDELRRRAQARRPELAALDSRIAAASAEIELAHKAYRPDLSFGLSYTAVGRRDDAQARAVSPDDNGDDILALSGSISLPVRKRKLEAGLDEAHARRRALEAERQSLLAEIDSALGDLTARLPLLHRHLELLEKVLLEQAGEALGSAETAYSTGKLDAVDLLDAEVMLFDVRITTARTRADLALAWSQLEDTLAGSAMAAIPPSQPALEAEADLLPQPEEADHES